ncbi:MAG: serine/threonine protein kinase [Candidatus Hydrogenedentes bacterium]|nr:serine/threonine protein kinase [Candidatus Hydrogenedentota bacterium]
MTTETNKTQDGKSVRPGEYAPGSVIADRYEVERMIGRGGMGVVYLVYDDKEDARVALKTIVPKYAGNKKALIRFMREARAFRELDHRAIVKFYDAGRLENNLYFTMEYVRGRTVRSMLRERGRFGLGSTVRILYLLCDGLQAAHAVSVHRDVSPANIMVTEGSNIKLLDFGLAKLINTDPNSKNVAYRNITMRGVHLGKRFYAAPEQQKDASTVDARADLYSVGVIFHEMLTGDLPIGIPSLTKKRPDLPEECDVFLRKTLAVSRDDRYDTAADAADALVDLYKQYRRGNGQTEE